MQETRGRAKLEWMLRPCLLASLFLLAVTSVVVAQPIYTWVGPHGTIHYADHPHPGAHRVELGAAQGFDLNARSAVPIPASTAPPKAPSARAVVKPRLVILAPANGASLFNIGGVTTAAVRVQGRLPGEELVYLLDGKRVAGPTTSTTVTLEHVWRGTHRLEVLLLAPSGRQLDAATSVFYVHQHSVLIHLHPPLLAMMSGGGLRRS